MASSHPLPTEILRVLVHTQRVGGWCSESLIDFIRESIARVSLQDVAPWAQEHALGI